MRFKHVWRITQWGYGVGAGKMPLYIFSVPAKVLISEAEIYRRTPERRDGYQRELASARLGTSKYGVAGYLLRQMGIFPTSILVNVRKEDAVLKFEEKERISDNITIGDLIVPDDVTWYVIDGQHRLEGLKMAMRIRSELENYPVLLTMTNEGIFYEMLIFYMVNSRAKSVPTDLAYRILQKMLYDVKAPKWIELEIMTGADRRKAIAATIVDYLNFKDESPFKGRIKEAGEPWKPQHITTDRTLIRYVTLILKERIFRELLDEEVADLLIDYWNAIKEIYPKCFENYEDYALLSTLGLSVMNRLFPAIYGYCIRDKDTSSQNMKKYLGYLLEDTPEHRDPDFKRPITEKWWHRTDGPGIIRGTGEGHYSWIATNLAQKIAIVVKKRRR